MPPALNELTHRPNGWGRERSPLGPEVLNHLINNFAELRVKANRIVAVDPGDEIGAPTDVRAVLIAPFDHLWKESLSLTSPPQSLA